MTRLTRSTWVRAAVTVGILAYLLYQIDGGDAWRALVGIRVWAVALTVVLLALDRLVMIWRWAALLAATRATVGLGETARIFFISSFLGGFTPAGVGGDAARAWAVGRLTARGHDALASVAVDRLLGVAAITLLGAAGAFGWSWTGAPDMRGWIGLVGALMLLGCALALWIDRVMARLVPKAIRRTAVGGKVDRLASAVAQYRRTPRVLAGVLALSLVVQLLRILQAWVLGLGLGIDVPFGYYLVFMPIGLLALLLPVSISGFGLPQGVIVWLLQPVGVPDATSFALSTLIVLSGIAANLPGAWLYLRGRRGRRRAEGDRQQPSS